MEASGPNTAPPTAHENECLETSGLDIATATAHSVSTNSTDDEFSDDEIDCISAKIQLFLSSTGSASMTRGRKEYRVTFLDAPHKLHSWEIIYVIRPQHMSYVIEKKLNVWRPMVQILLLILHTKMNVWRKVV